MNPHATVVIPLLNQRPEWLARCVRSALLQSVPTEVCVVFSPHTPGDRIAWLRDEAHAHPRLRVMPEERPGFAAALNTGIVASTTERVGFLLSDDWLEPEAVAECLPLGADIVSTGLTVYAADGRTRLESISRSPTQAEFARRPSLERKAAYLEHFFLFRRSALIAVGGLDETVGLTGCDDYDLIWTLLEHGASVAVLPRRLYNYRDHGEERLTLRPREAQVRDLGRILDKHGVFGAERERLIREQAHWFGEPVHVVVQRRAAAATLLGPDLTSLVAAQPAALVGALPLSSLRGPGLSRCAFRLNFADGTTRKGRRFETAAQAATVAELAPRLEAGFFARVLARHGTALLEEWIEGEPLDGARVSHCQLRACGRILGRLHAGAPTSLTAPKAVEGRLVRDIGELVDRGVLERERGRHAAALARRFAPTRVSTGLCHGDFCVENIVIRADGTPCLVDNEALSVGGHDYDLGRTWYRWPMSASEWQEFLSGYAAGRDPQPFLDHFHYWAVRVLIDATRFRLRLDTREAEVPLARLREIVDAGV